MRARPEVCATMSELRPKEPLRRAISGRGRPVVWLNPMPPARWSNTPAAALAEELPMFELSRAGLRAAVDRLRGPRSSGRRR